MAYVRRHGHQLELVHGMRSPESGQVEQRVLLSFYSRREALDALGDGKPGADVHLRDLLEREYPDLRFDWEAIASGLRKNLDHLPNRHDNERESQFQGFGDALATFARALWITDPFQHESAASILQQHQQELEVLQDLLKARLLPSNSACFGSEADPHGWRFAMGGRRVPPEVEEFACNYWEKGELKKAKAAFGLLVRAFDDYAEGHNYLGLIALRQGDWNTAIREFQRTVEIGRRLFPRRIAKSRYWSDHDTRPYMRGLRNLALVRTWNGQYEAALEACDRLDRECGDDMIAAWQRAAIHLNLGRWTEAIENADRVRRLQPRASLMAAFACYELGRREDAVARFLHALLNDPRDIQACLIRSSNRRRPSSGEADDLLNNLGGYLKAPRQSVSDFAKILDSPVVGEWMEEMAAAEATWRKERGTAGRSAFDKLEHMRSPEFAARAVREGVPT